MIAENNVMARRRRPQPALQRLVAHEFGHVMDSIYAGDRSHRPERAGRPSKRRSPTCSPTTTTETTPTLGEERRFRGRRVDWAIPGGTRRPATPTTWTTTTAPRRPTRSAPGEHFNATILSHAYYLFVQRAGAKGRTRAAQRPPAPEPATHLRRSAPQLQPERKRSLWPHGRRSSHDRVRAGRAPATPTGESLTADPIPAELRTPIPPQEKPEASRLTRLKLTWWHPKRWRKLDTIDLQLRHKQATPLWVSFNQGAAKTNAISTTNSLTLYNSDGSFADAGKPGRPRRSRAPPPCSTCPEAVCAAAAPTARKSPSRRPCASSARQRASATPPPCWPATTTGGSKAPTRLGR